MVLHIDEFYFHWGKMQTKSPKVSEKPSMDCRCLRKERDRRDGRPEANGWKQMNTDVSVAQASHYYLRQPVLYTSV